MPPRPLQPPAQPAQQVSRNEPGNASLSLAPSLPFPALSPSLEKHAGGKHLRVTFVRRGYSPTGGAEAYLKRFAQALLDAGHDCILWASTPWPDWPQSSQGESRVEVLEGRTAIAFAQAVEQARLENREAKNREPNRRDVLFSLERVDACDVYRAGDGVHRAWLRRRDAVEPFWKRVLRGWNRKHRQILKLEERLFCPTASPNGQPGAGWVIVNSRMVKEELVREYGYPAERITIIHNGLPTSAFAPVTEEERHGARGTLGLKPSDYAVLFVGSGWERKGLAAAIRGLAEFNAKQSAPGGKAILLVAGRGNERAYARLAGKLGCLEHLRFLGPVRDMRSCYAAADVFLLPTLYDPFSNASLEALAVGLPVITSADNGVAKILNPNGKPGENTPAEPLGEVLQDPTDAFAIARALEAWSDPAHRAALRPRIREHAARFTIEANVQATVALFQSAIPEF